VKMRIRIDYTKSHLLRYTGNLDMQRSWERTLRRAHLPVAYSQGFHPQPRINQAAALPLGFTSRQEIVDVWLDQTIPLEEISAALRVSVPPGVEINDIVAVDPQLPSIQTQISAAEFTAEFIQPVDIPGLRSRVDAFLSAETCQRQRREKTYDLRPLVEDLRCLDAEPPRHPALSMRLSARDGATGRADEVLSALGYDPGSVRIERTRLIFR